MRAPFLSVTSMLMLCWACALPIAHAAACEAEVSAVSPQTARAAGLVPAPGGRFVLPVEPMVRRAGSAERLLQISREQLGSNRAWFDAMEGVVLGPGTPLTQPGGNSLQGLYERARETHEVELALTAALECMLGQPRSTAHRPRSFADLMQAREMAQREAAERESRGASSSSSGFAGAMGSLTHILGTMNSVLGTMNNSKPQGGQGSGGCAGNGIALDENRCRR